jgi:hypothetical protein
MGFWKGYSARPDEKSGVAGVGLPGKTRGNSSQNPGLGRCNHHSDTQRGREATGDGFSLGGGSGLLFWSLSVVVVGRKRMKDGKRGRKSWQGE